MEHVTKAAQARELRHQQPHLTLHDIAGQLGMTRQNVERALVARTVMGRPGNGRRVKLTLWLPERSATMLREEARRSGDSLGVIAAHAIDRAFSAS